MSRARRVVLWAAVSFLSFVTTAWSAELQVGVATVDITPPVGCRLSGYFNERVSTGVHDPLLAKAVVFAQGETKAVMVICDLIGVTPNVTDPAAKRIAEKMGVQPQDVVISATHTHTGPLYYGAMRESMHEQAMAKFGRDPCEPTDYPADLAGKLVEAAEKAHASLRPVELFAGMGNQEPTISFNRRYFMADGKVQFNPGDKSKIVRPAGPIDPSVNVVLMRRPQSDDALAALTVFAMHTDTTGGTELSADYPHYLEKTLRERFGSEFVSIFGLGTCGNINHVDPFAAARRKASELGPMVGKTVLSMVDDLRRVEPALAVKSEAVEVPLQRYSAEQVAQARDQLPLIGKGKLKFLEEVEAYKIVDLQSRGVTAKLPVRAIRLGRDLTIVVLPGEVFVEHGLAIKQASPFKQTIVIELANDNVAYVPTKEAFEQGSYEPTNSRVAPGGGEMLVESAARLLRELRAN